VKNLQQTISYNHWSIHLPFALLGSGTSSQGSDTGSQLGRGSSSPILTWAQAF